MEVRVGVSNRHIHLTKQLYQELFGREELTWKKDLVQKNEFAAQETVTLIGPKNKIDNVRVLGPFRNYNQVEISKTDSYFLGVDAPVRKSGDLKDASLITIKGPLKEVTIPCCIIANRHIHISKEKAIMLGIKDNDLAKIKIDTIKGGIIDVYYKVSDNGCFELHLDRDDANAFLLKEGSIVEIIK